ncbi:MAG: cytochrome c maturation protein CcmE [Deltaproteobacteria bacterium]|nr:MAG: cytochrome c maturation protein CcmE [Deltaproteobacteria bacterium]
MTPQAKRRAFLVAALLVAGSALAVISAGGIGDNLVYYWTPSQVHENADKAVGATIRLGGVVQEGSVDWRPDSQSLTFTVGDGAHDTEHTLVVHAKSAPPQMFREGIGVVVEGTLTADGSFRADKVMVKHSNEYRAPTDGGDVKDLYATVEEL